MRFLREAQSLWRSYSTGTMYNSQQYQGRYMELFSHDLYDTLTAAHVFFIFYCVALCSVLLLKAASEMAIAYRNIWFQLKSYLLFYWHAVTWLKSTASRGYFWRLFRYWIMHNQIIHSVRSPCSPLFLIIFFYFVQIEALPSALRLVSVSYLRRGFTVGCSTKAIPESVRRIQEMLSLWSDSEDYSVPKGKATGEIWVNPGNSPRLQFALHKCWQSQKADWAESTPSDSPRFHLFLFRTISGTIPKGQHGAKCVVQKPQGW